MKTMGYCTLRYGTYLMPLFPLNDGTGKICKRRLMLHFCKLAVRVWVINSETISNGIHGQALTNGQFPHKQRER